MGIQIRFDSDIFEGGSDYDAWVQDRNEHIAETLGSDDGWYIIDDGSMDTVVELEPGWFVFDDGTISNSSDRLTDKISEIFGV